MKECWNRMVTAEVAEPFSHHGRRTVFHLARLVLEEGICRAYPVRSKGSGDVVSMAGGNGFLVTDPDGGSPGVGERRPAMLWHQDLHA